MKRRSTATSGHTTRRQEPSFETSVSRWCTNRHNTYRIGPVANPRTYSETPKILTSCETPNLSATVPMAVENMLEPNAAVRVTYPSTTATISFFFNGQFCACSGSSGPSNSTTYSSRSGNGGGKGLPPPKFGIGLLLCLVVVRLRMCAPIVLLCWLRIV